MSDYERVHLYSWYERVWHAVQGISVVVLLATGIEVHGALRLVGFERAVRVHEVAGFVLLGNALLGLFFYVTTGAIRQYAATSRGFAAAARRQVAYYARGIFRGEPHPVERSPQARLNPLQKATYVAILNVLLPWQVFSGLAIWALGRWPGLEGSLGGLGVLVPLHTFGAWAFAAFLVGHVYLSMTTGSRAMRSACERIRLSMAPMLPSRSNARLAPR